MTQYDSVAEQYERDVAPRYAAIADLAVHRALRGSSPSSIVELAAGTGNLTRALAPQVPSARYIAVDISIRMLEVAARSVDPGVELLVADLVALPIPSETVDLVVSALGPVQDDVRGLAEAARVLRPDGRLVVAMWGADYAERRLLDAARRLASLEALPANDLEATVDRFRRAGLVGIATTEHRLPVVHQSVADYLRYRSAFGYIPGMTPAELSRYDAALADVSARSADANGAVVLDWSIVVVEARKAGGPTRP